MIEGENIVRISIDEEMRSSYIDYSMSVIVARALPDVRDGLKPVHRRVLFGMHELGVSSSKGYKKSARIVGEVLGKYHPHGDSSVYMTMVRMAQHWSLRYPMIDGQGNFGSLDGDSPAAMRYTEAKMHKLAEETMADIEKDTVDFQLNFDDTLKEPTVLPTRIPNLLINGASGIAVGMATNMPPHNLSEIINGIIAMISNPEIDLDGLLEHVKAPDFPTGGIIYGYQGVKDAFETGRGRIMVRGVANVETTASGREKIIITEIPYMVNKAEMIMKTAELINDKRIDGISNVNDESDRNGMRIVYDLKKDAIANVVLNKLYKMTALQTSFSVNNIALVDGRPMMLNLRDLIEKFIAHRHDVVIRRTRYELAQAEKRAHILEGLLIALDNLDAIIKLIRNSKSPEEARLGLIDSFDLSEVQARAILDLRLQKLTGLERDKIREEYAELMKLIDHLKQILENHDMRMNIIQEELLEIKEKYGDERRTEIVYASEEFNPEDFYADEEMVITISHLGYMKRTPLTEFRTQARGGVGARGSTTRDEDFIEHMFIATMHNTMLFFTESGKCFWLKVYQIPEGAKATKGRAIQNLLNIAQDDQVKAYINVKNLGDEDFINNNYIILTTKKGTIKKTLLEAYSRPRLNGVNAITIKDGDQLLNAVLTSGNHEIVIATRKGKAIRFHEGIVRPIGRTASGVRGVRIENEGDYVVGMVCVENESEDILVISENGYGKRSSIEGYRVTNRGGKGVKTLNITEKTGLLIGILNVTDEDDLMIINRSGITIRLAVSSLRTMGRATQGVRLINLKDSDRIASVEKVASNGDEESDITPEGGTEEGSHESGTEKPAES
ncbi:MAG: DNA gyrase subunit A [Bacteroidetes bacterium]|jgi:DNA gyrase subunit A|nr:DNA gyrase subunit A [Bacteroidota bacterium]MBT5426550.1 DNA gyrase subunit A [Bacteroidota bacterium]MBT7463389.1 DNA gyrase subunit A [Bacteroidota bacterium]